MSDPTDIDLLAAEYVLGTLDLDERDAVSSRLAREADLARAVAFWEERLSPLSEATRDLAPPLAVFDRVLARLFAPQPAAKDATVIRLRTKLLRWRLASSGLAALAAALLAWITVGPQRGAAPVSRLEAVLQRDPGSPAMVVDVDLAARRLTLRPLAAVSPAGKSYELWIIDPAIGAPKSLGVVADGTGTRASLASFAPASIVNATFAVTVEPPGGSPTGAPSGNPILTGRLVPSTP